MSEERQSHLVFASGASWYAVPAECASEVVSFPELTRVPGAPAYLLGVFAHRGEIVPVVDLPLLLGGASQGTHRGVLLRLAKGAVALTANEVAGLSEVTGKLEPLGGEGVRLHFKGPGLTGSREVAVIDPEGLLDYLSQGT